MRFGLEPFAKYRFLNRAILFVVVPPTPTYKIVRSRRVEYGFRKWLVCRRLKTKGLPREGEAPRTAKDMRKYAPSSPSTREPKRRVLRCPPQCQSGKRMAQNVAQDERSESWEQDGPHKEVREAAGRGLVHDPM